MSTTAANEKAVVSGDVDAMRPGSVVKRIAGLQAFWILGVLIAICLFFTALAGERFLSAGNFSLISQNVAVW
ncbi:MAG TPA: ABC transporter permease, partial [Mycobacterium sp.]|nr:ABC transporter permease [Mycobacterium sp.]